MSRISQLWDDTASLADNDTARAILVLASVIEEKHIFDEASGENFGHELAIALKNVLEDGCSVKITTPEELIVRVSEPIIVDKP